VQAAQQRPTLPQAEAGQAAILWGALGSGAALALVAGLAWAWLRARLRAAPLALGLALVVGADLWRNAAGFWTYSRAHEELFRLDPLTTRITQTPVPYRVLDLGVYPNDGSALMAFDIPQLLGHHGNELHRFDELLGGKNQWRNLTPRLLDLLAVRYVIAPAGAPGSGVDSLPGYRIALDSVVTSARAGARLFERTNPEPYARVVPAALKIEDDQVVPTLLDPRFPGFDAVVLFARDAPVSPEPLHALPPPSGSRATVGPWRAGSMTIALDPPPTTPGYVLVAENWYSDWHATVDGSPAPVLRGNHTLITVPVPAGARRVELAFDSAHYRLGKRLTLTSLGLVLAACIVPLALRRRRRV
jgi:hypothetical protein